MSDAENVFPGHDEGRARSQAAEKRFIVAPQRRGGFGRNRVVEVVHVRRDGPSPRQEPSRPAAWSVRAETWPEGFAAKSAPAFPPQPLPSAAPEPAEPVAHIVPMWAPARPQPATAVRPSDDLPVAPEAKAPRRRSAPKPGGEVERGFADPFAEDDSGANCLRCGYLVEPAREKRGLMTCSACG
jgi:hypothetical protein